MKIVMINSLYPPNVVGGAEQSTKVIADAMAALGHELHVITLQGPLGINADTAVKVHEVPLANIYWPFNLKNRIPTAPEKLVWHGIDTDNEVMVKWVVVLLKELRPDVVLTHNMQGFSTAVLPAVKKLGIPLVHVLHDYSLLCPQTTMTRNGQFCGMHKDRCTSCRLLTAPRFKHQTAADAVIGVSRAVLDLHLAHGMFAGKHQTAIYNALKPSITVLDQAPVRQEGHVFTFGFLGRIEKSKGVETMLQAAARLQAAGVRFKLLIAGKGEPEYLQYLKETWPLESVFYVGYVNPVEFLPNIDTLVFPSEWQEALGNGVFEAFAHGAPVIGSNLGGIPETIQDGVNGMIFAAGNIDALTGCMDWIISHPEKHAAMAAAALAKARQYSPHNRASQYLSFLAMVISDVAGKTAA